MKGRRVSTQVQSDNRAGSLTYIYVISMFSDDSEGYLYPIDSHWRPYPEHSGAIKSAHESLIGDEGRRRGLAFREPISVEDVLAGALETTKCA